QTEMHRIYDFYSRDMSKKIRNVRSKMARDGQFASVNALYGFLKSPTDKHQLIVDEEAAAVVREIFQMKRSGLSARKITESLNERGIPSPAQYALNHKRGMDWRRVNQKSAWDSSKVVAILKDERYAGNVVSLRRTLNGNTAETPPLKRKNGCV
ncbi:MAG: recombinase family protein, partial [Clostridiales bacterium]|nr:recombinase family protein [Clostridiales bacterium]